MPNLGRYNRVDLIKGNHIPYLYFYASDNPLRYSDPLGLAEYKGMAGSFGGGGGAGGAIWVGDVYSKCGSDKKYEEGTIIVGLFGITVGSPLSGIGLPIWQKDSLSDRGSIKNMGGLAALISGDAGFAIGGTLFYLILGNTDPVTWYGVIYGVDLSGCIFGGYSHVFNINTKCCDKPGEWP